MANNKNFLDNQGLTTLLSALSAKIKSKTAGEIETIEVEDAGNIIKDAKDPNNFTTTHAVVEYLKNRKRIRLNQQSTSVTQEEETYTINNNVSEYNGEDEVQINFQLATASDIANLFASDVSEGD